MITNQESAQLSKRVSGASVTGLRPDLIRLVESYIQRFLGWFFHLFLQTFIDLQDALLAISPLRRLVSFALAPKCQPTVTSNIKDGSTLPGFDELQYFVSTEAKELLLHAGMHALIAPTANSKSIPSIGRILLQCDDEGSSKYPEAVAGALAHELKASFLVVEDSLRSSIAFDLLGKRLSSTDGLDSSFSAYLLSFWLSGGKVAFVWDVLRRICSTAESKPLVVLIKDAEHALCDTHESCDAFTDAFGKLNMNQLSFPGGRRHQQPGRRVILIAAAKLEEAKAKSSSNSLRSALEKMGQDSKRGGSGTDDLASLLFPELSLIGGEDKPNPKRMLEKLFMTHVRLKLPAGTPAAERHRQKLEEDAADLRESQNKMDLSLLGVDMSCLNALSSQLRPEALSFQEWSKVMTWARSMEAIIQTKALFDAQKAANLTDAEMLERLAKSTAKPGPPMRRCTSTMNSSNVAMDDMIALSRTEAAKPGQQTSSSAASPLLGFQLSERSLSYGLRMLKASKGKSTATVKAENTYEKNLLREVVSPEDAGNGFADVGALGPVKDVLREVVQFPLQYPDLFAAGSLASMSKGVLLFGPPGTGKTMLARAVAAECGASFLAIHPSAVASKWLGDGVRYIKAAFSLAQKMAPCVIFLDEVDALLSRRNSNHEHEALREMKNEAMAQWDGIRQSKTAGDRVIVLGATNRPQDLDDAVLRRFSRRIFCDLPDRKAREAILKVILAKEKLAEDVDLSKIAGRTDGYTGSDLRQVCTNAAMQPVRELLKATGKEASVEEAKKAAKEGFQKMVVTQSESASSLPSQTIAKGSTSNLTPDAEDKTQGNSVNEGSVLNSQAAQCNEVPQKHETGHSEQHEQSLASSSSVDSTERKEGTAEGQVVQASSLGVEQNNSAQCGQAVCHQCRAPLAPPPRGARSFFDKSKQDIMEKLLQDCDRMAHSAKRMKHVELRAVSAEDFENAIKQTSASTDKDSYAMDELRTWNATYGEGKEKGYRNPRLTYFI